MIPLSRLPLGKTAPHSAFVRVLCDVQFRLNNRLMFVTFIWRKGVDFSSKRR